MKRTRVEEHARVEDAETRRQSSYAGSTFMERKAMSSIRKRLGKKGDTIELSESLSAYTPEQRKHFDDKLNVAFGLVEDGRKNMPLYGRDLADKILIDNDPQFDKRRIALGLIYGVANMGLVHRSVIPFTECPPKPPQTIFCFLSISRLLSLQSDDRYERSEALLFQSLEQWRVCRDRQQYENTNVEAVGAHCNIHRIVQQMETQCDMTLFEIHIMNKNTPSWCLTPFNNRDALAPTLVVMDFIVDNEARFILRFVYVIPFAAQDVTTATADSSPMTRILHKQLCDAAETVASIGQGEITWTRNQYLALPMPLKDILTSLHLYYMGHYYHAPCDGPDTMYDKIQDDAKIREGILIPSYRTSDAT